MIYLMTRFFFFSIFIFITFIPSESFSHSCDSDGLLPKNNLHAPIDLTSDRTEERFNEILDNFYNFYSPMIEKFGATLRIDRVWKETLANAFAQRENNIWIIRVLGGMYRHSKVSEDAFVLTLCHEMGHQIGGAPHKTTLWRKDWASTEGQSDWWASMKCAKELWKNDNNIAYIKKNHINPPAYLTERCNAQFKKKNDRALCIRIALAGLSLSSLYDHQESVATPSSFDTPDPSRVKKTLEKHPKSQCRLDTYFQGSLCNVDSALEVSMNDENLHVCSAANGQQVGNRPGCWYRASEF